MPKPKAPACPAAGGHAKLVGRGRVGESMAALRLAMPPDWAWRCLAMPPDWAWRRLAMPPDRAWLL